jgi:hypothetical protein
MRRAFFALLLTTAPVPNRPASRRLLGRGFRDACRSEVISVPKCGTNSRRDRELSQLILTMSGYGSGPTVGRQTVERGGDK